MTKKTQNKKWIQSATQKMEEKGTVGSLKKYAKKKGEITKSGTIDKQFIDKLSASKTVSPSIKRKALFAKNVSKKK